MQQRIRIRLFLGLLLVLISGVLVACRSDAMSLAYLDLPQIDAGNPPLPKLVREIPMASEQAALLDLQLAAATQRLYVTDTAGKLYILDTVQDRLLATLPALGEVTLDEVHHRLYVAPGTQFVNNDKGPPVITVIDTTTNTIIGIVPGRSIAVDTAHNRLFVGEPINLEVNPAVAGIRLYDGTTLAQTGELAQAGVPFYNPLRDELLVMAHTVYVVDLTTRQVTTDLFPELAEQTIPWCNGCAWADEVHIFPEANLIAIYVHNHCMGGGCNLTGPPNFFEATTLQPLTDLARLPEVQGACGNAKMLLPPIDGRIYRTYAFQRYVTFNNLLVYDDMGALVTWRDGVLAHFINPQTAQAYLAGGDVLDLATLTPVGRWPAGCVFAYDKTRGLLYAAGSYAEGDQGTLQVIAQQGGMPTPLRGPRPTALAGHAINVILPSPAYADDKTLLVRTAQGLLFRSTDGGRHWQQLRGGLPEGEPLNLQVAFSPNYGRDHTLFAAGYRHEGHGEGVWRSTNGGDTWQPLWQGLTHLRITELLLSPAFTDDQTLLVKAEYYQVTTGQSGVSWQRSTDGGIGWSVVATSTYDTPLPAAAALLPSLAAPVVTLPVRLTDYDHRVEYTPDQGITWRPVSLPLAADEWVQTVIPAPTKGSPENKQIIYVLSDYHLWRTTTGGQQWEQWRDPLDTPRDYTNAFRTLAISPLLADGAYHLFLGTTDGQFLLPNPTVHWMTIKDIE